MSMSMSSRLGNCCALACHLGKYVTVKKVNAPCPILEIDRRFSEFACYISVPSLSRPVVLYFIISRAEIYQSRNTLYHSVLCRSHFCIFSFLTMCICCRLGKLVFRPLTARICKCICNKGTLFVLGLEER